MQFLLFASILLTAQPNEYRVVHQLDVYAVESAGNPFRPEIADQEVALPESYRRHSAVYTTPRTGSVCPPICKRLAYTALRASYFSGPYDYKKGFDYPWHTTPSPSLPDMIWIAPGGPETIPAPPSQ